MLSHQLVSAQHHLRVLNEEVFVLRRAQYDCSNMANDIYAYQQCVEAQRAELARTSPVKDADVGVRELLQQLSLLQKKNEMEARTRLKEQVRALKEEVHQLNVRIAALSVEHPERVEQGELLHMRERVAALEENVSTQVALRKQSDAEKVAAYADRDRLSVCVDEQRRHMLALAEQPGFVNPDTGVMSLMESVRQQAAVEFRNASMQELQALHAELASAREEVSGIKSVKEEMETMREVIIKQRVDLATYNERLVKTTAEVQELQTALNAAEQVAKEARGAAEQKKATPDNAPELVELREKNDHLKQLLETVTAREHKYVSDIQVLSIESEASAQRVRTMVQRHLNDRAEMQKRLDAVTEHRVGLQREVCRLGIEKQMADARVRELQTEVEYGKRLRAVFSDMQDVFVKHNFFQTAVKEETANYTAKMLELECTREAISPQNKSKRKGKKV